MPAYAKPGLRVPVWLTVDEHDEPRPTFYSRVLTMLEQEELGNAIDAMHEDKNQSTGELFARGRDLLGQYIDCWDHMPDDFCFDKLAYAEVRELLNRIAYGQFLEPVEKKDLGSQPLSDAEKSATNAA